MDRAAEFPLQARHRRTRNRQRKLFGCLLAFCLLAVLLLALAVSYLLSRNLREPQACRAEETTVRMPTFQKQIGTPPATELKPRAHLSVLDIKNTTCGKSLTLNWTIDETAQSEVTIEVNNGSLVIPKCGDYFVYAQISFQRPPGEKDRCAMETSVAVAILRNTSSYPATIELMKSRRSIHETQHWSQAIYLGGVASLHKDDSVFVSVSNTKLLDNQSKLTFFGTFFLNPARNPAACKGLQG